MKYVLLLLGIAVMAGLKTVCIDDVCLPESPVAGEAVVQVWLPVIEK